MKLHFRGLQFSIFIIAIIASFITLFSNYYVVSNWKSENKKNRLIILKIVEGILENFYETVNNEVRLVNFLTQNHSNSLKNFNYLGEVLQYGQFIFVNNFGQIFVNFDDFSSGGNYLKAVSSFIVKNIGPEHHLINYHIKVKNGYLEDIGHMIYTIPIGSLISKMEQIFSHIQNPPSFFILDKNYNEVYNSFSSKKSKKNRLCNRITSPFANSFYICEYIENSFLDKFVSLTFFNVFTLGCIILVTYFMITREKSLIFSRANNDNTLSCSHCSNFYEDSTFFSGVTHELRTPLSVIIAFSEIMKNSYTEAIDKKDYINHSKEIYNFSRDLLLAVDNIIDVAKYKHSPPVPARKNVNLLSLLEESTLGFASIISDRNIIIEKQLSSDLPKIFVDQTQIKRVITNIINNAIKLVNNGDKILITAYKSENNVVILSVENFEFDNTYTLNKKGICNAHFHSTCTSKSSKKFPSANIGMLLVESILKLNDAKMHINQNNNYYTKVVVELPISVNQNI